MAAAALALAAATVFAPAPGDVDVKDGSVYVTETDLAGNPGDPQGAVLKFPTDG